MSQIPPSVDSLPKQFVFAMRTLFDIMDDKKTGCVRLTDIENRWRDDRTRGLPKGVIESLQTFATPNGLLTFDRFCAGLNLCLLRNQNEKTSGKPDLRKDIDEEPLAPVEAHKRHGGRPSSVPLLDEGACGERLAPPPRPDPLRYAPLDTAPVIVGSVPKTLIYGPPKPPRVDKPGHCDESPPQYPSAAPWYGDEGGGPPCEEAKFGSDAGARCGRGPGDGKPAAPPPPGDAAPALPRKTRRREPRRHTLQNGIDYDVLKRMKLIEQEKEILVEGLAAIERTREWYLKELAEVQEKMRHASRMGAHLEPRSEAQQERLGLQRARVLDINRQLAGLVQGWRGGLALHMNLALQRDPPHAHRLLAEEVKKKNERISILEREKSALIRELLVVTNRNKNNENVF